MVFLDPKVVPGTPGLPLGVAFFLPLTRGLSEAGHLAASLMPRVRQDSEAADIDHGQLVYPSLEDVAFVVDLDELVPVGGRATSRRHGRRFERFATMGQDLPNRPWLRDERD